MENQAISVINPVAQNLTHSVEPTINVAPSSSHKKTCKRWTEEEDQRLIRHIMAFPQNLNLCFIAVAEETGRTKSAVASHWYSVVSKKPEVYCFFTASSSHVCRNRKNGEGTPTAPSIWRRLLNIIKSIC